MKLNKFVLTFIILTCTVTATYIGILIFDRIKAKPEPTQVDKKVELTDKTPLKVSCTRTSRLNNDPAYDRALSIIEERYRFWDDHYNVNDKYSFSFFPSQLVNCIKIEESNVRNIIGAEGYFSLNGPEIRDNYYPIAVDKSYAYADDYINALLLVHEITHVEQYIKSLNEETELSCIDKEAEAFLAQVTLRAILGNEVWKSIQYRIEYDDDLHPQLQILEAYQNNYKPENVPDNCHEKCLEEYQKNVFREILLKDDFYIKQCNL